LLFEDFSLRVMLLTVIAVTMLFCDRYNGIFSRERAYSH
jgi:hypothetical protein